MKLHETDYRHTVLINFPTEVTVGEVEDLLQQNTPAAKKRLIFVIFHRLNNRYVRPLNQIPGKKRSGFLTMAAACLLIEALQSFREGTEYTFSGTGAETFREFFSNNPAFHQLVPVSKQFYTNIRCGILHQAETYENWLVIREKGKPLFEGKRKAVHADVFMRELSVSLRSYYRDLSKAAWTDPLWKAARFKLTKICDHCKNANSKLKKAWAYCI